MFGQKDRKEKRQEQQDISAEGMNDNKFIHLNKQKLEKGEFAQVRKLDFSNMNLTDKSSKMMVEIVKNAPNLEEFSIDSNHFSIGGIGETLYHLQSLPKLEKINISNNPLMTRFDGASPVIPSLIHHSPSLKSFSAANTRMEDSAIGTLLSYAGRSKTLRELDITGNTAINRACEKVVDALSNNPNLTNIAISDDNWPSNKAFITGLSTLRHPNLLKLDMGNKYVGELTKQNHEIAEGIIESVVKNSESPDFQQRIKIAKRMPSIERTLKDALGEGAALEEAMQKFKDILQSKMPTLPEKGSDFSAFTQKNEQGFTALDNPDLWQHPEAAERLAGLKITREDLTRKTEKGASLLDSLAHGMPAKETVSFLNKQDIQLGKDELLDAAGAPNAAYQTFMEKHDTVSLFTPDNWRGKKLPELDAVMKPLSDTQKSQIPVQSLMLEMRRSITDQSRGR